MKTLSGLKTTIALAATILLSAGCAAQANEQPMPPPAGENAMPGGIDPGSPVGQVVKLVQAGVDASVIQIYISNCPSGFNLDADKIIALTDVGLPNDLINAMFEHDKNYLAGISTAAPVTPVIKPGEVVASAPPPEPETQVTVNYFYQNLSPYGTWVEVDGYGRCWRPNVVVYDSGWRPYCDRGRWVYSDCGWYWDSDYSWGVTFHYGRWFNSPRHGWCWWPDVVWAPSWVTWRSYDDYCGWAPLPPFTVYQPGIGFSYRGANVAVGFNFGLAANCFTFVSYGNFCEPHPRAHCLPATRVTQIYHQTTVVNNFNINIDNHRIHNNGISVTLIGRARNHPIQAVPISNLVNRPRHHDGGGIRSLPGRRLGADASDGSSTHDISGGNGRRELTPRAGGNQTVRQDADSAGQRHFSTPVRSQSGNHTGHASSVNPAPGRQPAIAPSSTQPPQQGQNRQDNNNPSLSPRQKNQFQSIKPSSRNDSTMGTFENAGQGRNLAVNGGNNRGTSLPAWSGASARMMDRPSSSSGLPVRVSPAVPAAQRSYTPAPAATKPAPAQITLSKSGNADSGKLSSWKDKNR